MWLFTLLMIIMIIRYSSTSICWIKLYWIGRNGVSLLKNTGLIDSCLFYPTHPPKAPIQVKGWENKESHFFSSGFDLDTPVSAWVGASPRTEWLGVCNLGAAQCPPRQRCNQKSNNDRPWAGMNNFISQVTRAAVFWDPARVYHHSFCSIPPWHPFPLASDWTVWASNIELPQAPSLSWVRKEGGHWFKRWA